MRDDIQNACIPSPPFFGAGVAFGPFSQSGVPFQGVNQMGNRGAEADDVLFFSTAEARDHGNANGEIKLVELTTEPDPGGSNGARFWCGG